jgi:Zn-dependent protease
MSRQMNKKDLGLVAFAGPAINAIIGAVSMILGLLVHFGVFVLAPIFAQPNIFILVTQFNALIALFNCIPVWQLDGAKILKWNKLAFFVLVAINIALIIPAFILNPTFLSFS